MMKNDNRIKVWAQRILPFCLFPFLPLAVMAQDKKDMFNPEFTSVTSQTIAPDARAGGMGDIGAATEADVASQYWNPAKYPFAISRAGVALNYTPWLRQLVNDIDLAYLAGYYRIGDYSAVSASLRYFSLGEVYTSQDIDNAMTINPYEMSIDLGYSLMLSEKFSLGTAVRWIYSDLTYSYSDNTEPGSAFAADLACYYQDYINIGSRECQLGSGMNISNIGSKITMGDDEHPQFIPTNLRLGGSLMIPVDEYNRFTIAADANKLLVPTFPVQRTEEGETEEAWKQRTEKEYYNLSSISGIFKIFHDAPNGFKEELQEIRWSVGAEYTYNDKFVVRAGYHHESENKGNRKYFTVGAGFKMSVFQLDAGYVIATAKSNPLDQTMRFSLSFDMDGIKDLFRR